MKIALGLYPKMTALDAMGPYAVLSLLPDTELVLCAEKAGRLSDDRGLLHLDVEATFDDVSTPDVLLVPGGFITRTMAHEGEPIVEWIRSAHAHTTFTTSVCTGALLLGAAGVLDGLEATTHWSAYRDLESFGATAVAQRVVRQGKVITGAGVSAGIDMALTLVGILHGDLVAEAIQLGIEYDPQPPFDSGSPAKASAEVRDLVSAVMGHD